MAMEMPKCHEIPASVHVLAGILKFLFPDQKMWQKMSHSVCISGTLMDQGLFHNIQNKLGRTACQQISDKILRSADCFATLSFLSEVRGGELTYEQIKTS